MSRTNEYDLDGMNKAANDIKQAMTEYENEVKKMDNELTTEMKEYFDDPKSKEFLQNYNEFKPTLDNIKQLMLQYSELLSQITKTLNEIYNS